MAQAYFRFYAELNDFLPAGTGLVQTHQFKGRQSIKDRIESFNVPHTEVALILSEGRAVDFSYLLEPHDYISVYPAFRELDLELRLRPPYQAPYQFVLDVHLGKLARYLRILGFDTWYQNFYLCPNCDKVYWQGSHYQKLKEDLFAIR